MKCLESRPIQIADKMRQVAAGVLDPSQAEAIRRYASWLEAPCKMPKPQYSK
jgi:hypothetical protein